MDQMRLAPLTNFMYGAPDDVRYLFEDLVAESERLARQLDERARQLRSSMETRQRVDQLREDLRDLLRSKEDELEARQPVLVAALAVLTTVESCAQCELCSDRAGAVLDVARKAGL